MQNGSPNASSAASPSRAPEIIFANWWEMLNQLKPARDVRHSYAQAIEGYLNYCVGNGLGVGVESARGFVSDALRRGLTQEGAVWKAALNWFFRAGRQRSAPQPEGVPSLGQADTGTVPWESRLIERLRLKHYSWRTEQTYREWAWRLGHFVEARGLRIPAPHAAIGVDEGTDTSPLTPSLSPSDGERVPFRAGEGKAATSPGIHGSGCAGLESATEEDLKGFLSELAVRGRVFIATQKQAFRVVEG